LRIVNGSGSSLRALALATRSDAVALLSRLQDAALAREIITLESAAASQAARRKLAIGVDCPC
jgi:hypothetical protein